MVQWLESLIGRARRPPLEEWRLVVTDEGVTVFDESGEVWSFRWEEISRVETYKMDAWAFDSICLDFTDSSKSEVYRAWEEMKGFDVLCAQLLQHFPSIAEDWWQSVVLPPFATNHRVLYERFPVDHLLP